MSKPRIFISSTFYDLRQVRSDLDKFITELGFEPVLNEVGNIPYGKEEKLEEYCYKEISNIDILVSIIGGRYGNESQHKEYSISQIEFQTAFKLNKQVYIFIDKNVHAEYQTYLLNKNNTETKYKFVDNTKVYEFIEFIESLPSNNNTHSFETSANIVFYLKEQWAGLFQRFLSEQQRNKEINLIKGIESTANTLNQLVTFLTEERKGKDSTIQDILLSNHPAMEQLRNMLSVKYRVFFTTRDELTEWLIARGYNDDGMDFLSEQYYYIRTEKTKKYTLTINKDVFHEDSRLRVYTIQEWKKDFITETIKELQPQTVDDLPF